ncbi:MAG: hypothetical protein V4539_15110 [Bacteroidota bacterium]
MLLKKPIRSFNRKDWLWVFLLALLMFAVFIIYNNSHFSIPGEQELTTKVQVLDEMVLPGKFKSPYDFVFINVGKDLELIKDEEGGDNVITDRTKLGSFLKLLADSNRHQFLLCDIVFDMPSPEDSLFREDIRGLNRAVFPKHFGDSGIIPSIFPLPMFLADYHSNTGKFSRFRLIYNDSDKTIPVAIHEQLQGANYRNGWGTVLCNNRLCLRAISPKYYIRQYDLLESKRYPYFNLGELLILQNEPSFYSKFLRNKFIVIGNFETDIHDTPVGKMPGSLILLNTYLSLLNGNHQLSISWIVTMFLIFFLISLYMVHGALEPAILIKKKGWWAGIANSLLVKVFSLVGLSFAISAISLFIFGVQCQVFSVVFFILVVNFLFNLSKPK